MNSKCTFCGAMNECLPFDGNTCGDEANLLLDMVYIKYTRPNFHNEGGYTLKYAHRWGTSIGIYGQDGVLLDADHSQSRQGENTMVIPLPNPINPAHMMKHKEVYANWGNYIKPKRLVLLSKRIAQKETTWQAMAA